MVATEVGYLVVAGALCSIGLAAKRALTRRVVIAAFLGLAASAHFGGLQRAALSDRAAAVGEITPDYSQGVRDLLQLVQRRHMVQIVFPLSLAILGWRWSRRTPGQPDTRSPSSEAARQARDTDGTA
jgi:hypothetical protein